MLKKKEKDKPRRVRRAPTWEEKVKVKAFQWLEEDAAYDPALRDAVIARYTDVDPAKVNRHASYKQQIEEFLLKKGLVEIQNDPELRRVLVRAELFKIMEMEDPELKPKPPKPDPLDAMISKVKKYQELKDLGKSKTTWEDVVKELLEFGAGVLITWQQLQSAGTNTQKHILLKDGQEIEISEAEHKEGLSKGIIQEVSPGQ